MLYLNDYSYGVNTAHESKLKAQCFASPWRELYLRWEFDPVFLWVIFRGWGNKWAHVRRFQTQQQNSLYCIKNAGVYSKFCHQHLAKMTGRKSVSEMENRIQQHIFSQMDHYFTMHIKSLDIRHFKNVESSFLLF